MIFYEIEFLEPPRIFNAFTVTNSHYYNVIQQRAGVFEVAIVREGRAVYQHADGSTELVGPMQMFTALPDTDCEMFGFNSEVQIHDSIQVKGQSRFRRCDTDSAEDHQAIKDRVRAGETLLVPYLIPLGEKYDIALQISSKIISLAHSPTPSDRSRALSAWYELMALLTETVISTLDKTHIAVPPSALHYAHDAKLYIAENYALPLRVEDIATHLGISSGYLHALFKEVTGLSLMDYVNRYRVEQACTMVSNTSMSLREIGELVGIPDPSYMSRLFKKITGLSFKEYRQREGCELTFYTSNP